MSKDGTTTELLKTLLHDRHASLGANMVEYAGWSMPLQYPGGIVEEHLATRKGAGLFDVSHMGRFVIRGGGALDFLQRVLSNNAAALEPGDSQYTIISNADGGAIDDAYLYRFVPEEYVLVVNASNRDKDWGLFQAERAGFTDVELEDRTEQLAMLSLQGPASRKIVAELIDSGALPEPARNKLSVVPLAGARVMLARTGYAGEPICFELFVEKQDARMVWDVLLERGAKPVGLGARDTLRLEAGLPLYGHELGQDPEGNEIPILASPVGKMAVSFSPLKGEFNGREALAAQFEALKKIGARDYAGAGALPRLVRPVALAGKGVARSGSKVYCRQKHVGYVTSGTMVPYWKSTGQGLASRLTEQKGMRPICLALLDNNLHDYDNVEVEVRAKRVEAVIVPYHMRSETPPYARSILLDHLLEEVKHGVVGDTPTKVQALLQGALENTVWRQHECINLIPSENTQSVMTRLLSVMDPAHRYAEHRRIKAFDDADIFYYQGTDFIREVEELLEEELLKFLGCREVEARPVSGQMSNAVVFSALMDYLNRYDRKSEPRRIRRVMNNHIIKGGHLSAQPMGALRDFVARDPKTEKPGVLNFPVLADNLYKIDVAACGQLIEEYRPELIIFGKSMVLHPEPVAEIRAVVDQLGLECFIMYDMAHVLGLVGPHFQEPFKEGADFVTGSTHKTFFGTQRGIVAANWQEHEERYGLWETVRRRVFPGSVSNHHLGTLVGLLLATYEMNHFKDEYQKQVLANAKAFARALKEAGVDVAGDPAVSYTQTHQVIINVGYAKGPEAALNLENNNIVLNYQASPEEEGFTAAGSLRMGVQEMTRFGMGQDDFQTLAQFIRDVVVEGKQVKEEVKSFRQQFLDLKYCFADKQFEQVLQKLHRLI